jgi:hypothetical protein
VLVIVLAADGTELWRFDDAGASWLGPPEAPPQESFPPPAGCTER